MPYIAGDSPIAAVDQLLKEREDVLTVLQHQLRRAQCRMRSQVDQHRSKRVFQIGDWVLLKLQPYRQTSLASGKAPKLAPKYYGPFKVVDTVGKVAYQLDLPPEADIHDIFHVSQLKKAMGFTGQYIPLPIHVHGHRGYEPAAILDRKMVRRGNRADVHLLIHWKNLSPAEATWEFASEIRKRFPTFSLEDKGT